MINVTIHTKNKEQVQKHLDKKYLQYMVGGLLYTPATHATIAEDICNEKYRYLKAIALCLEDAISDHSVKAAEEQTVLTISRINEAILRSDMSKNDVPLIFIRIRSPEQMQALYEKIDDTSCVVTGYILPKFDLSNAESYKRVIEKINSTRHYNKIYVMPILESASVIDIGTRVDTLLRLKTVVDSIKQYTLNIRVGGNDLCNKFGLRRNCHQTIYDIAVVRDALADIINIFGREYIVSGPVWEYFDNKTNDAWSKGLKREIELDKLNGFIGKTAIHPTQLPLIMESMMVDYIDYKDAKSILNWESNLLGVAKSERGERMNESKVHYNWAKRILILAEIYGVRNDEENG